MIRKALESDLGKILEIYSGARRFMEEHGNPGQWGKTYPPKELVEEDLFSGKLYAVEREGRVCGVFYFALEDDESYRVIENGAWRSQEPYGVIHRVAAEAGAGGVLKECVEWCRRTTGHLRIDTHKDNVVMQKAVAGQGFEFCGIVYTADGSPRMAYELLEKNHRSV